VSVLAYAEITSDGGVKTCSPPGTLSRRQGRGVYEVVGLSVDRYSTIIVQPKPLPPGDCAGICASVRTRLSRRQVLDGKTDKLTIYTRAVVSLDELRVDADGQLRWEVETEDVDADFSLVVL
jgi:hypothetical protein